MVYISGADSETDNQDICTYIVRVVPMLSFSNNKKLMSKYSDMFKCSNRFGFVVSLFGIKINNVSLW